MPALVVFDCFDTIITSRPLPEPQDLTARLARSLSLAPHVAGQVVQTVYGTVLAAMRDPAAEQPATMDLVTRALAAQGETRSRDLLEQTLWHAWGCAEPGAYRLCAPIAEAARRVAAAGHTVRLMSNCFLPGNLMADLLRQVGAPAFERALFTADGGPKKPDPRAYALIGAGDFDRRVMVGDAVELDITPAVALGWDAVLIKPERPDPTPLFALLTL